MPCTDSGRVRPEYDAHHYRAFIRDPDGHRNGGQQAGTPQRLHGKFAHQKEERDGTREPRRSGNNQWSILHDGNAEGEYATKEAAFESAVAAASLAIREGHEVKLSWKQATRPRLAQRRETMMRQRSTFRRHGFAWVTATVFAVTFTGHWVFGWFAFVNEQRTTQSAATPF
jgi:hypothetical protein